MNKRAHDETPRGERRPLKIQRSSNYHVLEEIERPILSCNSPRMQAKPMSEEKKKKYQSLMKILDQMKQELPIVEDFIIKLAEEKDDYVKVIQEQRDDLLTAKRCKDTPFDCTQMRPVVPLMAKEALDNFMSTKMKVTSSSNVRLEEELIMLNRKHQKLAASKDFLKPDILKLVEECCFEIENCDQKLQLLKRM